jgi:exopolyphosphatase/guanosine-5'-triphosphate,3'-diphosphate pyrophosphatase
MQIKKIASIDIGTNTLLMLVAEVDCDTKKILHVIEDHHLIARLGEGVDLNKNINENAINRAIDILRFYKMRLNELNVDLVEIVATSALRDAENKEYVCSVLSKEIGYDINVVSGEEEARLSYLGTMDLELSKNTLVLDIGGGSSELIYGENIDILNRKSFDIGAVRLTERFIKNYPPSFDEIETIRNYIKSMLIGFDLPSNKYELFSVAGTPTTLAQITLGLDSFVYAKIHNYKMNIYDLMDCIDVLTSNSKEDLIAKYKIHPSRADILLSGALILDEVIKFTKKDSFFVSCHGLRYGVLINSISKLS